MFKTQREMAKSQDTMNNNMEASIKNLEMKTSQLSRQMAAQASSSGRFNGNILSIFEHTP